MAFNWAIVELLLRRLPACLTTQQQQEQLWGVAIVLGRIAMIHCMHTALRDMRAAVLDANADPFHLHVDHCRPMDHRGRSRRTEALDAYTHGEDHV